MDFKKKETILIRDDKDFQFFDIKRSAQFQIKRGMSSLISSVYYLSEIDDDMVGETPDYVLSDTLDKDVESAVATSTFMLQKTKYLPSASRLIIRGGATPDGDFEGVNISDWEDFDIVSETGAPLYTADDLQAYRDAGQDPFATVLWLIVKDICDCDGMLSSDWYCSRILYEYFQVRPLPKDAAFLIGILWQELCLKDIFESDLETYYSRLEMETKARKKGTDKTKIKADELRAYCVQIAMRLAVEKGPKFMMAPPLMQAKEIRHIAISERGDDFLRGSKHYSEDWFLKQVVEDRRLDIVEAITAAKKEA